MIWRVGHVVLEEIRGRGPNGLWGSLSCCLFLHMTRSGTISETLCRFSSKIIKSSINCLLCTPHKHTIFSFIPLSHHPPAHARTPTLGMLQSKRRSFSRKFSSRYVGAHALATLSPLLCDLSESWKNRTPLLLVGIIQFFISRSFLRKKHGKICSERISPPRPSCHGVCLHNIPVLQEISTPGASLHNRSWLPPGNRAPSGRRRRRPSLTSPPLHPRQPS